MLEIKELKSVEERQLINEEASKVIGGLPSSGKGTQFVDRHGNQRVDKDIGNDKTEYAYADHIERESTFWIFTDKTIVPDDGPAKLSWWPFSFF